MNIRSSVLKIALLLAIFSPIQKAESVSNKVLGTACSLVGIVKLGNEILFQTFPAIRYDLEHAFIEYYHNGKPNKQQLLDQSNKIRSQYNLSKSVCNLFLAMVTLETGLRLISN